METRTAGQAIVEVLRAEGVRHMFGLPGGRVLGIYDALHPGMIEPVEHTDSQECVDTQIQLACRGWGGSDPIRREDG